MPQLSLFKTSVIDVALSEYPAENVRYFKEFNAAHPEVYRLFKEYALQMRRSGRTRYGASGIRERIRWDMALAYPKSEFKITNNITPMLARLAMAEYPQELGGFFKLKRVSGFRNLSKREIEEADNVREMFG